MKTTKLNIRTDKFTKEQAEKIFNQLGLNISTAINMFLIATIRENRIPFELKIDTPNKETIEAIEEGRKMILDKNTVSYSNMEELLKALEED